MRVLITGATGMIGQGVLRECLAAPDVTEIVVAGRTPLPERPAKVKELIRADLTDWSDAAEDLKGLDACSYCLGVSAGGMSEADYRRITFDFTVALAKALKRASPKVTFCFISGAGTNVQSRTMWARVKGEAEQALKGLGFERLFLFRPASIQPMDGIVSKTASYRAMYTVVAPLYPLWKRLLPGQVTSTREVGQARLQVTRAGFSKDVLETPDINRAARGGG